LAGCCCSTGAGCVAGGTGFVSDGGRAEGNRLRLVLLLLLLLVTRWLVASSALEELLRGWPHRVAWRGVPDALR
jgi:hypothetical protein